MELVRFIAYLSKEIASGKPIWKISAPAAVHKTATSLDYGREQIFSNYECLEALDKVDASSDPIERLGLILKGYLNPFNVMHTEKPFNPTHGEFIECTMGDKGQFNFQMEQINHHPPVSSFRVTGPTFSYTLPEGNDMTSGFRIAFNHVEIHLLGMIEMKTTSGLEFEFSQVPIRIGPLLGGKRSSGLQGPLIIIDKKGEVKFEGQVKKPGLQIEGSLIDMKTGEVLDKVKGDMSAGLILSSTGKIWFDPVQSNDLKDAITIPKEVQDDPKLTGNVWKDVYNHMTTQPPNWKEADMAKDIVEKSQREEKSGRGEKAFVSRYGFHCKYMQEEEVPLQEA